MQTLAIEDEAPKEDQTMSDQQNPNIPSQIVQVQENEILQTE